MGEVRPVFRSLKGRSPEEIFGDLKTPAYVIDEAGLIHNGSILKELKEKTGCKILLAQKAFSNYNFYPLLSEYLDGTEASGLFETRLGAEEMPGKEVHVFCAAYTETEFEEILRYADHIVFNSPTQLKKYGKRARQKGKSIGLRVNPECSTQSDHAIYDPCAPGSRLGTTKKVWDEEMTKEWIDCLDGLHFHTLCEQDADDLEITIKSVEEKFGEILPKMKWLNMGGGHHITRDGYQLDLLEKIITGIKQKWNLEVYLEPGEAVALNAGYFAVRVIDIVKNEGVQTAILDASAACHMPDVIEMPYMPPLYNASDKADKPFTYRLAGPTCLSGDVIGDYSFGNSLKMGDLLLFGDMAIYTTCKNNTFNGMALPTIWKRGKDGSLSVIREFGYHDFKMRLGGKKMREFKKSSKLDNVLYDVRGPVVEEAARMEAAGTHVLKLNIGNPAPFGFSAPDEVIHDMRSQLIDCEGYSHSKGLFSARKAIMQYMQNKKVSGVAIDDIYTGNGVSELINLSMLALLNSGDEVLVPAPDYPLWTACVTLAGGKAVHYICDEEAEWNPDIDDIRKKITDRTKAIVIINPNNPTGALYPKAVLEEIVEIARQHQLIIFSDEIYDRLIFNDEEHVSVASLCQDVFCVTFSGLSKSHMVAGYRVGWMVLSGNKKIAQDYIEGLNMLSNMRLCSNVPAQSIVQTSLGGYQSVKNYIVPGGRVYEQCEYIYKALNEIPGISAVKPKAGFYIFPKLDIKKFNITDDEKFTFDLLRDKKILLISGKGFNWPTPDHFRIVYLPRVEVLEDAVDKMRDFFSYYRQ